MQDDYLNDNVPENLKEVIQSKGVHRDVLEVKTLKAVTQLANETVKSLKNQNWINLCFLIFGSFLSILISNLFGDKNNSELLRLINNQKSEILYLKKDFESNLNDKNKRILELEKQLNKPKK